MKFKKETMIQALEILPNSSNLVPIKNEKKLRSVLDLNELVAEINER